MARALFAMMMVIGLWLGASSAISLSADPDTALFWARAEYCAVPFLPTTIYLYAVVGLRIYSRRKPFVWLLVALAVAFVGLSHVNGSLLAGIGSQWWGSYPLYGRAGVPFLAFFLLAIGASAIELWIKLQKAPSGSPFRERIYTSLLAFVVLFVGVVDFAAKFGAPIYPAGYLAAVAFAAIVFIQERRFSTPFLTPAFATAQILETMQGAVVVAGLDGTVQMSNESAAILLGRPQKDLLGSSLTDIFVFDGEWRRLLEECLADGSVRDREVVWKTAAGGDVEVSVSLTVVTDGGGEILGVVFAAVDISGRRRMEKALRQSEATLRAILECAQVGIVIIDPSDHTIVAANRASLNMIGARAEDIVGTMCHQHICPTNRGACPVTDLGQTVDNSERILLTAAGKHVPIIKSVAPLLIDGRPHLVESFLDISRRKEMEEALAAEKEHLELLNRAATEMSHCLTTAQVLRVGIRLACETTGADAAIIWLLPSTVRSRFIGSRNLTRKGRLELIHLLRTSPNVGEMLRDKTPVQISGTGSACIDSTEAPVFGSVALDPLVSRGNVLGALCLAMEAQKACLGRASTELAHGIAALIGVALANARMYEDAQYLAERDPVTNLLNQRGMDTQLEKELARSERSSSFMSLVMMDLDGFKRFNDVYGHAIGDQVLKKVAGILEKAVRRSDVVGRYGGDEFLALLPGTNGWGAVKTVERIRRELDTLGYLEMGTSRVPIRMSYGSATYPSDGLHLSDLLATADANLYRSKSRGGDCITGPDDQGERGRPRGSGLQVLDGLVPAVDNKDHFGRTPRGC